MAHDEKSRMLFAGSLRARPLAGYGLAVGSAGLALGVRLLVDVILPPGFPFLTFFPAIIVTSFVAGTRPGTVCALLSVLAAWYFVIPPVESFSLAHGAAAPLMFFAAVSAVDIVLIHVMQQALDRLGEERLLTARLADQQRNLFAELQHRVANNMAFISGLLRLQKRRIAADPANAAMAFDEAVVRIETMGRVHRQLYDPAAANLALQAHLQKVCEELIRATGATGITVTVDVPALEIALDRLLPLSLLVAEIVTNSLKHAFPHGRGGNIAVTVEDGPDGARALVIRDDGIGLPDAYRAAEALGSSASTINDKGLGMRIVAGLANQIGGSISMSSDGGTVTRVVLPA